MRIPRRNKDAIYSVDMHKAVNENNVKKVKAILSKRRHLVNVRHEDETLLHIASEKGFNDIVLLLITMGSDVEARNNNGWTPLLCASMYSQTETVDILLENEANPRAKCIMGNTPLHYGAQSGNIKILLNLMHKYNEIDEQNIDGWTSLHRAVYSRQVEAVKFLLNEGANPKIVTSTGKSAYDMSVNMMFYEIAKVLQKYEPQNSQNFQVDNSFKENRKVSDFFLKSKEKVIEIMQKEHIEPPNLKSVLPKTSPRQLTDELLEKTYNNSFRAMIYLKRKHSAKNMLHRQKSNNENIDYEQDRIEHNTVEKGDTLNNLSRMGSKNHNDGKEVDEESEDDDQSDECPVCLEIPLPPVHIYQCFNGHIYCGNCKSKPNMTKCPQCGDLIIGLKNRNRYAEEKIAKIYSKRVTEK